MGTEGTLSSVWDQHAGTVGVPGCACRSSGTHFARQFKAATGLGLTIQNVRRAQAGLGKRGRDPLNYVGRWDRRAHAPPQSRIIARLFASRIRECYTQFPSTKLKLDFVPEVSRGHLESLAVGSLLGACDRLGTRRYPAG